MDMAVGVIPEEMCYRQKKDGSMPLRYEGRPGSSTFNTPL
jgi:hypothetical protein